VEGLGSGTERYLTNRGEKKKKGETRRRAKGKTTFLPAILKGGETSSTLQLGNRKRGKGSLLSSTSRKKRSSSPSIPSADLARKGWGGGRRAQFFILREGHLRDIYHLPRRGGPKHGEKKKKKKRRGTEILRLIYNYVAGEKAGD